MPTNVNDKRKSTLYVVATPIGNLEDISLRALRILQEVDYIVAEDTRHSAMFLHHFSILKPLLSLPAYQEKEKAEKVINYLLSGQNVALITDAGTPVISDPGYYLIDLAHRNDILVTSVPGCCAAVAALSISGIPAQNFYFAGFLSPKQNVRLHHLEEIKNNGCKTAVIYESPLRIINLLKEIKVILGEKTYIVAVRELTKLFESIYRGNVDEVINLLENDAYAAKGEYVVILNLNCLEKESYNDKEVQRLTTILSPYLSLSAMSKVIAAITGVNKKEVYRLCHKLNQSF